MSHFVSPALGPGESRVFKVDQTWSLATFFAVFADQNDPTARYTVDISVDGGDTWFSPYGLEGPGYFNVTNQNSSNNSYCFNAIRVTAWSQMTATNSAVVSVTGK